MITLPGLRQSGARVVFNTIFIHPKHKPEGSVAEAMAQLDVYDDIYREHSENVFQIRTRQDIDTLSEGGKKSGFSLSMEGSGPRLEPGTSY